MLQITGRVLPNRSYVAVRPGSDRFALAYQFENWIEVRDIAGQLLTRTRGPREAAASYRIDQDNRFHWNQDNQSGYVAAYGTEDFFFLLWCGCYDIAEDGLATTIHQFDWEGGFVRQFGVSFPLLDFVVSSTGDRVWGFLQEGIPYAGIGEWEVPPISRRAPEPETQIR